MLEAILANFLGSDFTNIRLYLTKQSIPCLLRSISANNFGSKFECMLGPYLLTFWGVISQILHFTYLFINFFGSECSNITLDLTKQIIHCLLRAKLVNVLGVILSGY